MRAPLEFITTNKYWKRITVSNIVLMSSMVLLHSMAMPDVRLMADFDGYYFLAWLVIGLFFALFLFVFPFFIFPERTAISKKTLFVFYGFLIALIATISLITAVLLINDKQGVLVLPPMLMLSITYFAVAITSMLVFRHFLLKQKYEQGKHDK